MSLSPRLHRAVAWTAISAGVGLVFLAVSTVLLIRANEAERAARAEAEAAAEEAREEADQQVARTEAARAAEAKARAVAEDSDRQERRQRYATTIRLAHQAWQTGRSNLAAELLRELLPRPGQEELRGFEWRYLWRLCHAARPRTFRPHTDRVASVAFTPDGQRLVTSGADGVVALWEARTGRPLRTFVADPDDATGGLGVRWVERGGSVVLGSFPGLGSAGLDGRLRPGDELLAVSDRAGNLERVASARHAAALEAGPPGSTIVVSVRRQGKPVSFTLVRRRLAGKVDDRPPALAALSSDGNRLVTAFNRTVRVWDISSGEARHKLTGHAAPVAALALSADGKLAATGDAEGVVRLWDVAEGKPVGTFSYRPPELLHAGVARPVRALAFSPDGTRLLASAGPWLLSGDVGKKQIAVVSYQAEHIVTALAYHPDGKQIAMGRATAHPDIELWDAALQTRLAVLHGHGAPIRSVSFTPDGEGVLSADGHAARLWDRRTGTPLRLLRGHALAVSSLACSPDGRTLATGDQGGTVVLHDLDRDPEADTLPGRSSDPVRNVAFADRTLFTCAGDLGDERNACVSAWDVQSGAYRGDVQGPPPSVFGLAYLPDGKTILAAESPAANGSLPGVCRLYDPITGTSRGELTGHSHGIFWAVATPDGETLITAAGETADPRQRGEIIFWDSQTLLPSRTLGAHRGVVGLALSANGRSLLSYGYEASPRDASGQVVLWDVSTGRQKGRLEGGLAQVAAADLSPDGKLAVTSAANPLRPDRASVVQLWDVADSKPLAALTGHEGGVEAVLFAPDGRSVWTGGWDGRVRLHEVPSGKLLRTLPRLPGGIASLALTRDGKRLAVGVGPAGGQPGLALVLDAATGKDETTFWLTYDGPVRVRFAPDGKSLAASVGPGGVRVFDLETKQEQRLAVTDGEEKNLHSRPVVCLTASADGKTLFTGGWDQTVRLWDVSSEGDVPARPRRKIDADGVVSCLAASPDGKALAWGTSGGLTLYDLAADKVRAALSTRPAGITAVAFSPDGSTLAAATDHLAHGGATSEVWLMDARNGRLREIAARGEFICRALAFSPDGKRFAFERGGDVVVLSLAAGSETILRGQAQAIHRLAFAPDGRTLATAGRDGTLRLWQVSTGRELLSLPHESPVESLAFSPDGVTLVSGGSTRLSGVARLWRAGPVELVSRHWFVDRDGPAYRQLRADEAGNLIEDAFFDTDGKPLAGPDGYHRFSRAPRPRYEGAAGQELVVEVYVVSAVKAKDGEEGLKTGDVLLRYNNQPVESLAGFLAARRKEKADEPREIVIRRTDKEVRLMLSPGPLPATFDARLAPRPR